MIKITQFKKNVAVEGLAHISEITESAENEWKYRSYDFIKNDI